MIEIAPVAQMLLANCFVEDAQTTTEHRSGFVIPGSRIKATVGKINTYIYVVDRTKMLFNASLPSWRSLGTFRTKDVEQIRAFLDKTDFLTV